MGQGGEGGTPLRVEFRTSAWTEEVERLKPRSPARQQAERARRQLEVGRRSLSWRQCDANARDGTSLSCCWKLYVPLEASGASAAPWGFVFRLTHTDEGTVLRFIAFGERHPTNPRTKSVYKRAHRRLHGRYP